MISLKQLNYALAVEKHLHFKNAAESCFVSQSALSTAITELERQLGLQIFERDNKKVLVTQIGKQVLQKAHNIILQVGDLHALSYEQQAPLSYPLSLGVIPTIAPFLLPLVLPELAIQYPNLELQVLEEQSHILVDKVRRGDIDMAILALPYDCDGLLCFEFWEEDFYWITHSDHMRPGCNEVTANEMEQSKLMLLHDGHCLKDQALSACNMSAESSHKLGATSLNTLIQLVAGKLGTTLVPEMAIDQLISGNALLSKARLSEHGPHRRIAFITRPNFTGVNNIELLMALFKTQLQKTKL